VIADAPSAASRPRIVTALPTGVRALDALATLGRGQRVGLFAAAGCGKTTLLAAVARGVEADAIVFALVGERGREVREFLERELDPALAARAIVVCATSDRPAIERVRAAQTATAIAEHIAAQARAGAGAGAGSGTRPNPRRNPVPPLPLHRVTARETEWLAQCACRHVACAAGFTLTLAHTTEPMPAAASGTSLLVETLYGPLLLADAAPLCALLTGIDPASASADRRLAAELLHMGFALLPEPVASLLGQPVPQHPMPEEPPLDTATIDASRCWRLHCHAEGASATLRIAASQHSLFALLQDARWRRAPQRAGPHFDALTARVLAVAGYLTLPAIRVATLRRGDLLRSDDTVFDFAGRGRLQAGPFTLILQWQAHAAAFIVQAIEIEEMRMTQEDYIGETHDCGPERTATANDASEFAPTGAFAKAEADAQAMVDVLDRMPVRMRFVLGELDVTLGTLRELRSGQYLRLRAGLPPAVSIEANAATIGRGELVDCDGVLAVQITQWQ
jgi:type III secretion system YscQ/HrcQ family protein